MKEKVKMNWAITLDDGEYSSQLTLSAKKVVKVNSHCIEADGVYIHTWDDIEKIEKIEAYYYNIIGNFEYPKQK